MENRHPKNLAVTARNQELRDGLPQAAKHHKENHTSKQLYKVSRLRKTNTSEDRWTWYIKDVL